MDNHLDSWRWHQAAEELYPWYPPYSAPKANEFNKIFMSNGKSPRKPFVLMKSTTIHPPPHNASSALRLRCNGLIDGLAGGLPLLAAGVAWIGTCQWIFVEDLLRENGGWLRDLEKLGIYLGKIKYGIIYLGKRLHNWDFTRRNGGSYSIKWWEIKIHNIEIWKATTLV